MWYTRIQGTTHRPTSHLGHLNTVPFLWPPEDHTTQRRCIHFADHSLLCDFCWGLQLFFLFFFSSLMIITFFTSLTFFFSSPSHPSPLISLIVLLLYVLLLHHLFLLFHPLLLLLLFPLLLLPFFTLFSFFYFSFHFSPMSNPSFIFSLTPSNFSFYSVTFSFCSYSPFTLFFFFFLFSFSSNLPFFSFSSSSLFLNFLAYYAWPRTYPSRSCNRNPWRHHVHRTTRWRSQAMDIAWRNVALATTKPTTHNVIIQFTVPVLPSRATVHIGNNCCQQHTV